jgi:hypothetical protein
MSKWNDTQGTVMESFSIGINRAKVNTSGITALRNYELPNSSGTIALLSDISGGANATRHDYTAPYSYMGTATSGSAEASTVWTIKRINVAADGTTIVQSASAVTWTGRAGHTYA